MKKITGLVVLILAVLFLGSYYGMGLITERTLKKNLEMANQSPGLSVQLVSYKRGWFHSLANLHWHVHVPANSLKQVNGQILAIPAKDYQADMPIKIYHGPLIYADSKILFGFGYARTHLTLPVEYEPQFHNIYTAESTKPTANLGLFVSYLNKTFLHVNVPKFKMIAKDNSSQFEWLGMESDLRLSPKMDKVEGSVNIDGINFIKHQLEGTIGKVSSEYDLKRAMGGLYLGEADINLPSIILLNNKQKIFEVEQFSARSQSGIDDGLFNSSLKVALDKIFANGKFYGPGQVELAVKNLDAEVLAQINQQLTQIQQKPEIERQHMLLSLLPEVPRLLNKGAKFEVSDMSLTLPQGDVKGNMDIALPKGEASNPFQLLQKIQGNGRLDIAQAVLKATLKEAELKKLIAAQAQVQAEAAEVLAQTNRATTAGAPAVVIPATVMQASVSELNQKATTQSDAKIAALIKVGALAVKDDIYVIEFKLAQGQLLINGKPINSAMMQF